MQYLFLAISCSVIVSVLLKVSRRNGVILEQAIALNYAMAFSLNFFWFQPSLPENSDAWSSLPWGVFLALGVLLPSVFIIMGRAVEYAGIAKSDAAQRLSLILPIIAAVTLFGQQVESHKVVGVVLAFAALFCLLARSDNNSSHDYNHPTMASKDGSAAHFVLLGVWLGYGVIDILFKQLSKYGSALPVSLAVTFALSFVLITGYILMRRQTWNSKSIIGGLILGVFNFFNILFYIKAHQHFKQDPTLVFTAMNVGVIALGTLVGTVIFREQLRKVNVLGLAIAIAAIVVLFYGKKLFSFG